MDMTLDDCIKLALESMRKDNGSQTCQPSGLDIITAELVGVKEANKQLRQDNIAKANEIFSLKQQLTVAKTEAIQNAEHAEHHKVQRQAYYLVSERYKSWLKLLMLEIDCVYDKNEVDDEVTVYHHVEAHDAIREWWDSNKPNRDV